MINFEQYRDGFYKYRVHCTKCYDGDTCTLTVDLGFGLSVSNKPCRLFGINTPELRGGTEESKAKGYAARDFLSDKILDKNLILYTIRDDQGKYGRLLGILYTVNNKGEPNECLNKLMLDNGHAVEYVP